ncbi:MAG: DUF4230 domain-containing protein [Segetibacter sp.]|nr:DUF4230 domain-containing protein [Segetibacter sp.]
MKKIISVAAIAIAGIWLLQKINVLPTLREIFSPKPLVIDETPVLIKEIRSIGQLITATLYDEVVVDSIEITKGSRFVRSFNAIVPFRILPSADKQIVLVARGKVLAGTDLNLLADSSMKISGDTVWLQLPRTKILDAIINPSGYEIFVENGNWSPQAVTAVKLKAREMMIDHAFEQNIIDKASMKTKAVMEDFLHAAGFKIIVLSE